MTAVGWGISICIGIGFVWVNNKIHAVTEEKESIVMKIPSSMMLLGDFHFTTHITKSLT